VLAPCNNDIDRRGYLDDVHEAVAFIEGRDEDIDHTLVEKMNDLATDMRFEEAELIRRKLDKFIAGGRNTKTRFLRVEF